MRHEILQSLINNKLLDFKTNEKLSLEIFTGFLFMAFRKKKLLKIKKVANKNLKAKGKLAAAPSPTPLALPPPN